MKVRFYSEDGKVFDTKSECIEYENELAAKEAEEKKKIAERENRKLEVEEAYNRYVELLDKYVDDYGEYTAKIVDNVRDDYPFINSLLRVFDLV